MTYDELIQRLDPTVYESLKRAIELGKWPDGHVISREQRSICLEAVMVYESRHGIAEEDRVGYIDRARREQQSADDGTDTIRILN